MTNLDTMLKRGKQAAVRRRAPIDQDLLELRTLFLMNISLTSVKPLFLFFAGEMSTSSSPLLLAGVVLVSGMVFILLLFHSPRSSPAALLFKDPRKEISDLGSARLEYLLFSSQR